tara:strand:+ start:165 stop:362 length:198 start_codon:yes stop_codon:yes gene_type:complete
MSMEIELSISDYHNIMNWYELAFAKHKPTEVDTKEHTTLRKISVMAQALIDEQKVIDKHDDTESA